MINWKKVIGYIICILVPLFVVGLMMIILSDGVGMILGGIAFWVVLAYFGKRLYDYIKENK